MLGYNLEVLVSIQYKIGKRGIYNYINMKLFPEVISVKINIFSVIYCILVVISNGIHHQSNL